MKYPLDNLTPTLVAIAEALAAFDEKDNYCEEITTLARKIREASAVPTTEDVPLFMAAFAVHAMILTHIAERKREATIDARAEKHVEAMRTMKQMEETRKHPPKSDNLFEQYLALAAADDSKKPN